MIIWLIGYFFCYGLMIGHDEEEENFWKDIGRLILLLFLWPLLLGSYVYFILENIEKGIK